MADIRVATRQRPIIRVFVSSTFSDFKLERDSLQRRVFPKLEQLCLKGGFQFQAIDLRWGVPTEAGLHHRTMRICFEELRRSQEVSPEPNFLILVGNRYGWRPLPEEISADEFQRLEDAAGQLDTATHQDSAIDVLRQWYLLDENSLSPAYVLQPRRKPRDGDPNSKDYTTLEVWQPAERTLWQIVNRAFAPEGLRNRFQFPAQSTTRPPSIVRFQASATEQEIWTGALSVVNAERHVRAFFRNIRNRNDYAPCEAKDFFDLTESEKFDDHAQTAQEELKEAIRTRLGDAAVTPIPFSRLNREKNKVVVDATEEELQRFCDDVESALKEIIEPQIQEYWEPMTPAVARSESVIDRRAVRQLEIERDEHLRFANERGARHFFVGRDERDGPLERIRRYIENDSRFPLVIHGPSGCGKTALLARSFQEVPDEKRSIVRFLGVTPSSSDLRSFLRTLCQELRERNTLTVPVSADVQELVGELRQHLAAATSPNPVIVFLDALDQLSDADNSRQLFWLPYGELPENVKIIVSCLSDRDERDPAGQPYRILEDRSLPAESWLNLDALSLGEARTLLFDRWMPAASRQVTAAQRQLVQTLLASRDACRQPLYLKLLFEEAKLWRSWDAPTDPGGSVSELLHELCRRLCRPENHGALLVQLALGYLGAARRGLSETEILEVLFANPDYKAELDEACKQTNHTLQTEPPRVPIAIWSRLRSDLSAYLTERAVPGGTVLTWYHRQVGEWVRNEYVGQAHWNPHGRLAAFFGEQEYSLSPATRGTQALPLPPNQKVGYQSGEPARSAIPNLRKLDELPWQLANGHLWQTLLALLNEPSTIESYEICHLLDQLLADIQFALTTLAPDYPDELSSDTNDRAYLIFRLGLGRDLIYAQVSRLQSWQGEASLDGPLPASIFESRAVQSLRRVYHNRATSSEEHNTCQALLARSGISDDLLGLAAFAFAKSEPVNAWRLGATISDDLKRLNCLETLCQLARSLPPDLILDEAKKLSEKSNVDPRRPRGMFLANAVSHLVCMGAEPFKSNIYSLFHSDSELLPLVHFFRALPPSDDDERSMIVNRLLSLSCDYSGPYEAQLFFDAALALSRQLPIEARRRLVAKAREILSEQTPELIIMKVVVEYAALGEFEQIISLIALSNYRPLVASGFAIVAALTGDDRLAKALLCRLPSQISGLNHLDLWRYRSEIPWPFKMKEPQPISDGDPRYRDHWLKGPIAVLYGELHRRFGMELRGDSMLGRLLCWLPHMRAFRIARERLHDDCRKVRARLLETWKDDHASETRSPEQWRALGLEAQLKNAAKLPDWCELESPSIQPPEALAEAFEQQPANVSADDYKTNWDASVEEICDAFERNWSISDLLPADDSPDMDQPAVQRQEQPFIDVEALRQEVEGMSRLKQTSTGRGFHDEEMFKCMEPVLRKLRFLPQSTAVEIGTRLLEIMGSKWYSRHQSLNDKVVQFASEISVALGKRAIEGFEKGVQTDHEKVRTMRICACDVGEIEEAIMLLGQQRTAERAAPALAHVARLLPKMDDARVTVYERFAKSLARLSQGRYAQESFQATATAAKLMRGDHIDVFGRHVLRALRFEGAPQCVSQLVPILLQRTSEKRLPALLVEFTFPTSQLAYWRTHLPVAFQALLSRAFGDWREAHTKSMAR